MIEMKNIEKRFPGVVALKNVNFDLHAGEVHALIGENGAGKSTLMKILSGVYVPTAGVIAVEGAEYPSLTPKEAISLGISVIFQELSVIDSLSILENLFVGKLMTKKWGGFLPTVDFVAMRNSTSEILKQVGLKARPDALVATLSISQKQQVEIAKALAANAKVIIMDEPTSSLNQTETEHLFQVVRCLRENGVGIVYISHKMRELRTIGDRITILKDGATVRTIQMSEAASEEQIVAMMVGRELTHNFKRASRAGDRVIFKASGITRLDGKAKGVSFDLREGEILGFAGLVGAGRTELMNSIFGAEPVASGKIYLDDKELPLQSPYLSIKNGIGMITENRRETGFMENFEIWRNLVIAHSMKRSSLRGLWGLVRKREEMALAEEYREKMRIKCAGVQQMISTLSGGNQQKVIIAKWLAADVQLLIFDEPTRGIDVGAKNEIYYTMRRLANNGKGIVMVSSELPDLLSVCDRIAVFAGGRISAILNASEATEEKIMMAAM